MTVATALDPVPAAAGAVLARALAAALCKRGLSEKSGSFVSRTDVASNCSGSVRVDRMGHMGDHKTRAFKMIRYVVENTFFEDVSAMRCALTSMVRLRSDQNGTSYLTASCEHGLDSRVLI